jgi:NDP-4-keto-2,6-dideoxyhexose 3-C-methyltransferase
VQLTTRLDFGDLWPCGVFPPTDDCTVLNLAPRPLVVVQCDDCRLVQLAHDAPLTESFGETFGYRSGTNSTMVKWLGELGHRLTATLEPGDLVIDIGSNDGTFLHQLPTTLTRVGVDPVSWKFIDQYPQDCSVHAEFWGEDIANLYLGRAKAITCFACLYDLPDPNNFMANVVRALAPDGVFVCEVAYGLTSESWDVACHEHLEYFHIEPLQRLLTRHGLTIFAHEMTKTQGGSLLFWAKRKSEQEAPFDWSKNTDWGYHFSYLRRSIARQCQETWQFLDHAPVVRVHGLCASTKGNTLLQVFGLTKEQIPLISDANPDKVGRFTPGTFIPIVSEEESRALLPDYYYVLSHQFADELGARESWRHQQGTSLIVPIPSLNLR